MELSWLRYFVELASTQHMTKVAEKLGISQPNLSMVIRRLEDELGVKLFDRVGRRLVLNQYGKAFLPYASSALASIDGGKEAIAYLKGVVENEIVIATTGTTFLFGLLKDFLREHGDARVRQFVVSREDATYMLLKGEADVAITSPPIEEDDVISTVDIYEDKIWLAVGKKHHLADKESIDLRMLKDEKFIDLIENYSFRKLTDEMCRLAGFVPNIVFEGEIMLMAELVEEGLGVSLVPESVMRLYPDFPVKLIDITFPQYKRKVGLSWLRGRYMTPVEKAFVEFASSYYNKQQ